MLGFKALKEHIYPLTPWEAWIYSILWENKKKYSWMFKFIVLELELKSHSIAKIK